MNKQIIGLIGPAGSGKTTLARLMTGQNFRRMRIASPIKRMLETFLFDQGVSPSTISQMLDGDLKEISSEYLGGRTPRHAMQTLGSEWRDMIHKELWIDAWERLVNLSYNQRIVVDDVRFIHEADRIKKLGGQIIRVSRPGSISGLHESEREYELIGVVKIIMNDRDPPHMLTQMNTFLGVSQ